MSGIKNRTIFTGDNLEILRGFPDEFVDLIYLDPPFNSKHNYAAPIGSKAAGAAFKDTWTLQDVDVSWWGEIAETNTALYKALEAAKHTAGKSAMSYLIYMAIRILEMHRILKSTGSIYLHCDPTMSHYLKMVLDAIFKKRNFRNEIIWKRSTGQKGSQHKPKKLGPEHDVILFYCKNERAWKFVNPKKSLTKEESSQKFNQIDDDGRRWMDDSAHIFCSPGLGARPNLCYSWKGFTNPHPSGWRLSKKRLEEEYQKGNIVVVMKNGKKKIQRRIYEDQYAGTNMGDLWDDVLLTLGKEDLGYPTQKPLALLERIIQASTRKDDMILDPFCGCATACSAAERLNRKWIGIDISPKAVELMNARMVSEAGIEKWTKGAGVVIQRTDIPIRKGNRSKNIKHQLFGVQEGRCNLCKHEIEFRHMEVDHVIPRAKGGPDDDTNLQLLCGHCNRVKGKGTMAEAKVRLKELRVL